MRGDSIDTARSVVYILGAGRAQLSLIIVTDTITLVGLGLVAGLALAWAGAARLVRPLRRRAVRSADAGVVSTLVLGLALFVTLRPALDVARLDLASVLREE